MKKYLFGFIGLLVLGGAGWSFYQSSRSHLALNPAAAPTAGSMYAMVNLQRIHQLSGPTYKGLSYKENYPRAGTTARQKVDTGRVPASVEPASATAPSKSR